MKTLSQVQNDLNQKLKSAGSKAAREKLQKRLAYATVHRRLLAEKHTRVPSLWD